MKRSRAVGMFLALTLTSGLTIFAAPDAVGKATQTRLSIMGLAASFSDTEVDANGDLVPGAYHEAVVEAVTASPSHPNLSGYVCVSYMESTVDRAGLWHGMFGVSGCGRYDKLRMSRGLKTAHLVASVPVAECFRSGKPSDQCPGTIEVDLVMTGFGRATRWHATQSDGSAGMHRLIAHMTGARRDARPIGVFRYGGDSLIDEATRAEGYLFVSKESSIETGR